MPHFHMYYLVSRVENHGVHQSPFKEKNEIGLRQIAKFCVPGMYGCSVERALYHCFLTKIRSDNSQLNAQNGDRSSS